MMDEKKQHILSETYILYNKYGIKSITMDDVAQHLGISKKTLYQFVSDKSELVEMVMDMELQQSKAEFETHISKEKNAIEELIHVGNYLRKTLKRFNPGMDFDLKKYYPEIRKRITNTRRERMYNTISQNLEKGKKQGYYRMDINVALISKLQLVRIENLLYNDLFTIEEITQDHFFNEILHYHICGISNAKGLAYFNNKRIQNQPTK